MSWLGGTVQRWIALVGFAGTVIGIATFAVSEHLPWAWLAIGGMFLLLTSFGVTARQEYLKRIAAESPGGDAALERFIADGRSIAGLAAGPRWDEWQVWKQQANAWVRARHGVRAAHEIARLGVATGVDEHAEAVLRQVSYLEGLREQR
jgi:HAMP domain-containing protein